MKKILLIDAYSGGNNYRKKSFSHGLLSIGTLLGVHGFRVEIVDSYDFLENYKKILNDEFYYIGLSVMTPQVPMGLKLTALIKELRPEVKIAWGGIHSTLFPEQTISNKLIDIVVTGEGEYPSLDLAKCMQNKADISQVKGIYYKSEGEVLRTPDCPVFDINNEPYLNYDLPYGSRIVNVKQDLSFLGGARDARLVGIISGRGCPYQCTFCINNTSLKKKFRFKSATRLLDEIEFYIDKYRIDSVRFQDEEFFISKERIFEFLEGIEKRKIKISWTADVRANHFVTNYITEELAKRIKASGCFHWSIGVESASARILEKLKKNITIEQVLRVSEISRKAGIRIGYGFMIGIPGERKDEIVETMRLAYKLKRRNAQFIIFSIFRPYPGSELYKEATKLGLEEVKSLEDWGKQGFYETGFMDIDSYPWIENKNFIKLVKFTTNNLFSNYKRAYSWLMWTYLLKFIASVRIKINYWSFPVEYKLFNFARRYIK